MARESMEQRRARLAPGAAWLTAERERRGLSGRELARRLAINPDRIFAYERAQDEPGKDFVALLAKEYGLAEVEVWRGLGKDLPREFENDEQVIAWALRNDPETYDYWLRRLGGRPATRPGNKPKPVTRRGDGGQKASRPEEPAV